MYSSLAGEYGNAYQSNNQSAMSQQQNHHGGGEQPAFMNKRLNSGQKTFQRAAGE